MAEGPLVRSASALADLTRMALVGLSRDRPERAPRPDGERLRFIFTIDTEISMGGAARDPSLTPVGPRRRIWADTEEGLFGITRFMDLLEDQGHRAVFFFEPVARAVVGAEELERAAQAIADRGHDVELHVHPEFEMDLESVQRGESRSPPASLHLHSIDEQRRYIRESADVLERWTGRRPIAFRAGGYSASEETLAALASEGIPIDSSYNAWAVDHGMCGMKSSPRINDVAFLDGTLEVPVTNLVARGPRGGLKPLELSSLNASEMIAVLDQLWESGARVACSVTHSFRLVRALDVQYRDVRADAFNLHRLRVLSRHLAANRDRFEVCTYRDLPLTRWRTTLPPAGSGAPYWPTPPAWSSALRLAVQAVKDRGAV